MKLPYLFLILLNTINGFNINRNLNVIQVSGYLNSKLCKIIKNEIDYLDHFAQTICNENTIKYSPIVLQLSSLNGDQNEIISLVKHIENDVRCPIFTINNKMIGGFSSLLFLAGKKRIFRESSVFYMPNIHCEITQQFYTYPFGVYIPMYKLSAHEAMIYHYCDEIIYDL